MPIVKVIELISEGSSIENAIENGLSEAQKTVRDIQNIYVKDIKAMVKNNEVAQYRLIIKVSFLLNK